MRFVKSLILFLLLLSGYCIFSRQYLSMCYEQCCFSTNKFIQIEIQIHKYQQPPVKKVIIKSSLQKIQKQQISSMPPKKSKKRSRDSDQQFPEDKYQQKEKKILSKWEQALKQNANDKEDDQQDGVNAEELYTKPKKAIFQYDFSHQRALDKKFNQQKPQNDKLANLTQEQLQQLKRQEQKQKQIKQMKNQQKKEKQKQKKKQIDAQKAIQKVQKQKQELQNKKVQEHIRKHKNKQSSPWLIPGILFGFLIFMFLLQYKKQIHERLSKFQNDSQEDYYQILQADQGNTDRDLKQKYKKLVLKYHPDRNQHCHTCKQKFDKIMQAWQVLGDPQKRKNYDQNSGHISELKSISTTLTPHNYHYLVEQSKRVWMIQVYDSTDTYSRYFGQFWEDIVTSYGDIVGFGRVDVWTQSEMLGYLPYKFQVFPAVYVLDDGYSEICSFDFQMPIQGLKKCLESLYDKDSHNIVKQVPKNPPVQSEKLNVYLDGKLRANLRIKAFNKMYQKFFNFYYIQRQAGVPSTSSVRQATLFSPHNGQKYIFNFTGNTKKTFSNYERFLQSFIIQEVSTCTFIHECEQSKCILVLNNTKLPTIRKQLPLGVPATGEGSGSLPEQTLQSVPVYTLNDNQQKLSKELKHIQQALQMNTFQNFDIGLYEGGRIDLGYLDEVSILNIQEGERLELECRYYGWRERIAGFAGSLYRRVFGDEEQ